MDTKEGSDQGASASTSTAPTEAESTASTQMQDIGSTPILGWSSHVGVATDRNGRWRRTMEDAHVYQHDFNNVPGQGYFAIFDGHAGKFAAEWCRDNMSEILSEELKTSPDMDVREVMKNVFLKADDQLETESAKAGVSSGCTAVMSFIRSEPCESGESFQKRVLYTANVGDARTVLCRGGRAIRLTYDHKGTDEHESKRITEKGGFLLNNRVNGVLAVTRSLGDFPMKEFVVGAPFTTCIDLCDEDEFLIIACDGLWDVVSDQDAVNFVSKIPEPQQAASMLLKHALENFSTDNTSIMIVRFTQATK